MLQRFIHLVCAVVASSVVGAGVGAAAVPTAAPPPDMTSAEVCELIDPATITEELGVDISGTTPQDYDTPQCSYDLTDTSGEVTTIVVAVQRAEGDLGGRVGKKAFKYAVKVNKQYADKKTTFARVGNVGERATFIDGSVTNLFIVLAHDGRVVTILGGTLSKDEASVLGAAAVESLV